MRRIALILILCGVCFAQEYVDGEHGNDTTGDGTIGTPWATIQKGIEECTTGQTVYVRGVVDAGGQQTYTGRIYLNNARIGGKTITVRPYSLANYPKITENVQAQTIYFHTDIASQCTITFNHFEITKDLNTFYIIDLQDTVALILTDCIIDAQANNTPTVIDVADTASSITISGGELRIHQEGILSANVGNVSITNCTISWDTTSAQALVELNSGAGGNITIKDNTITSTANATQDNYVFNALTAVTDVGEITLEGNTATNLNAFCKTTKFADYVSIKDNVIGITDDSQYYPAIYLGLETTQAAGSDTINDAGAAVDKYTSDEYVGIPITGHIFEKDQRVAIDGTDAYDGEWLITEESANEIVINAGTFTAESFSSTDRVWYVNNPYPLGGCVVANNVIINSGTAAGHAVMIGLGAEGCEVTGNYISGFTDAGAADYGIVIKANNCKVTNNVVVNSTNCIYLAGCDSCVCANNTAVAVQGWAFSQNAHQGPTDQTYINPYDNMVYNNIFVGQGNSVYCFDIREQDGDSGRLYIDYNCYYKTGTGSLAYLNGDNRANLAAVQAVWAGLTDMFADDNEQNSLEESPSFDGNYVAKNSHLKNSGYPVSVDASGNILERSDIGSNVDVVRSRMVYRRLFIDK